MNRASTPGRTLGPAFAAGVAVVLALPSAAAVDVSGRFDGPIASVTVNTTPGAFLGDRWWAEQVSIVPGTNQLAAVITPPAAPAQTNTLSVVNAPAEVFQYDLNGCMTSSGAWTNIWDEENRLIETAPVNPAPGGLKVVNQYDPLSRRTVKQVFVCTAPGQWTLVREHRFTWIDWLMVREYVADMPQGLPPLQTVRDYVWGVDLSGTLQGAGAVGGLLAVVSTTAANPQPAVYYPGYDGNGNVCSATDAAGALAAAFEYDPFGNLLSAEGPAAAQIPFRFSTKYTDAETRLVYYGYRFYAPELGRWPNRDPIGEIGGENMYCIANNDTVLFYDILGMRVDKDLGKINCSGWAVGENCGVYPLGNRDGKKPTANQSASEMLAEYGFNCTKTADKCECACDETRLVFYIYNYDHNPDKKDPFTDKWINSDLNDWHAIRAEKGCDNPCQSDGHKFDPEGSACCTKESREKNRSKWAYMPHRMRNADKNAIPLLTPDPLNPDSYEGWPRNEIPTLRYCCCSKTAKTDPHWKPFPKP